MNKTSEPIDELKSCQDAFYTFVNELCRRIVERERGVCFSEQMSGCLYWEAKGKDFVGFYATPFWEQMEVIPVALFDAEGDFVGEGDEIPFHIKDLTMNVEKDAERYSKVIREHFKKKYNVDIPHADISEL